VLSEAQRQPITSVRICDIQYGMDDPTEHGIFERLDPTACALLRTLAQIKTLKRIVIYGDGWHEQEELQESYLGIIHEELAKGDINVTFRTQDMIPNGYLGLSSEELIERQRIYTLCDYINDVMWRRWRVVVWLLPGVLTACSFCVTICQGHLALSSVYSITSFLVRLVLFA
jgi:hypothetical protein